ncbi:CCHC-type domain-containing protein [Nephila pilipes]|uniref:CCHC-type domain-containing protein n=1 Tax=Nephila pilipes TaxID=299642 RepID=A0A8X6UBI0_NEPPI|nr:CCHC-type domain-containing protein [Nephila pilipes]
MRSFNGNWSKQPFGEKKSNNLLSRKKFEKTKVSEIKKLTCFTCGSDKHFRRDCPKNKGGDNKRINMNKVSTEGTELEDGTVAARVDLLGKVIPRQAIEDKLSKLVKTSINVDGKLVHALVDSGTEITVVKNGLSSWNLSSQYLGDDSGDLGETEVSSGILLEKAPENVEDSQSNITSCRNEMGTTITKDKEVTTEADKGSMVADSFRSEQDCCAELAQA